MGRCCRVNYIWDNYFDDNIYKIGVFSPYLEETGSRINGKRLANPLFRFSGIFEPLLRAYSENQEFHDRCADYLENILFHYLAQLDRKSGIRKFSVEEYLIELDVCDGLYGYKVGEIYERLSPNEQKVIKKFLFLHNCSLGKKSFFKQALNRIFCANATYYNERDGIYLIYLPNQGIGLEKEKLQLLLELFMDVTATVRIFWQYHFGIIGQGDTMKIDCVAIY